MTENLLLFFYQSSGVSASVCCTFFCAQNISLFNEIFYTLCIDCADTSMHQTFSFWTAESSEVPGTHANDGFLFVAKSYCLPKDQNLKLVFFFLF